MKNNRNLSIFLILIINIYFVHSSSFRGFLLVNSKQKPVYSTFWLSFSQPLTPEPFNFACQEELNSICSLYVDQSEDSEFKAAMCLKESEHSVSDRCLNAIYHENKLAFQCFEEIQSYCHDVKPGKIECTLVLLVILKNCRCNALISYSMNWLDWLGIPQAPG
jgi:hypothetical protein